MLYRRFSRSFYRSFSLSLSVVIFPTPPWREFSYGQPRHSTHRELQIKPARGKTSRAGGSEGWRKGGRNGRFAFRPCASDVQALGGAICPRFLPAVFVSTGDSRLTNQKHCSVCHTERKYWGRCFPSFCKKNWQQKKQQPKRGRLVCSRHKKMEGK